MHRILYLILRALMKIYVEHVEAPWVEAKFFASWEGYQKSQVYHERFGCVGFKYAVKTFLYDKGEQNYYLRKRIEKEPNLRWKIWFAPFSIPMPDMLETAAEQGLFGKI